MRGVIAGSDRGWVEPVRRVLHVREDRNRVVEHDSGGGGGHRVRRNDHLVARLDSGGRDGHLETRRRRVHADRMLRAEALGERLLAGLHSRAAEEVVTPLAEKLRGHPRVKHFEYCSPLLLANGVLGGKRPATNRRPAGDGQTCRHRLTSMTSSVASPSTPPQRSGVPGECETRLSTPPVIAAIGHAPDR